MRAESWILLVLFAFILGLSIAGGIYYGSVSGDIIQNAVAVFITLAMLVGFPVTLMFVLHGRLPALGWFWIFLLSFGCFWTIDFLFIFFANPITK